MKFFHTENLIHNPVTTKSIFVTKSFIGPNQPLTRLTTAWVNLTCCSAPAHHRTQHTLANVRTVRIQWSLAELWLGHSTHSAASHASHPAPKKSPLKGLGPSSRSHPHTIGVWLLLLVRAHLECFGQSGGVVPVLSPLTRADSVVGVVALCATLGPLFSANPCLELVGENVGRVLLFGLGHLRGRAVVQGWLHDRRGRVLLAGLPAHVRAPRQRPAPQGHQPALLILCGRRLPGHW